MKIQGGTYAVTADTGDIGLQTKLLVESIREHDPDGRIINFIPSAAVKNMSEERLRFFKSHSQVVTGEFPIPEYPLSALHRAFIKASNLASSQFIIALDSDTVLTAPLTVPQEHADLYLRPAGFARRYLGSEQAKRDWQRIFNYFDVEFPSETLVSICDCQPFVVPFYNAGVVITSDRSFAEEWLDITEKITNGIPIELPNEFFADQVAMTVLAEERDVQKLTPRQNFQLNHGLQCPDDVQLIHYINFAHFYWLSNPVVQRKLEELETFDEIPNELSTKRILRLYLNRSHIHLSKYVPYPYNQYLRYPLNRLL